jgi:hypothetical protein
MTETLLLAFCIGAGFEMRYDLITEVSKYFSEQYTLHLHFEQSTYVRRVQAAKVSHLCSTGREASPVPFEFC